jgi:hypothetical protein
MLGRKCAFRLTVLAIWAIPGIAWAQQAGQAGQAAEGGSAPSFAVPYFVVLFGALLGLMVTLNPSKRRDRPRQEQFSEKKKVGKGH